MRRRAGRFSKSELLQMFIISQLDTIIGLPAPAPAPASKGSSACGSALPRSSGARSGQRWCCKGLWTCAGVGQVEARMQQAGSVQRRAHQSHATRSVQASSSTSAGTTSRRGSSWTRAASPSIGVVEGCSSAATCAEEASLSGSSASVESAPPVEPSAEARVRTRADSRGTLDQLVIKPAPCYTMSSYVCPSAANGACSAPARLLRLCTPAQSSP